MGGHSSGDDREFAVCHSGPVNRNARRRFLSYPDAVQLEFPFLRADPQPETAIDFIRERRARKYILRVRPDGSFRVTIPRGGSRREAEAFLAKHRRWAEQERLRVAVQHAPVEWRAGDAILLRGKRVVLRLERCPGGTVLIVGEQRIALTNGVTNLRGAAEAALRLIAERELIPRLYELAKQHDLVPARATIRDQRSRWGSCSHGATIALNFRLVQMPPSVCDYVLLHELMHLREQNHSMRFWRLVEQVYPAFREAERWLRVEGRSLF
jgi:predicted metal-dependent hydrolase